MRTLSFSRSLAAAPPTEDSGIAGITALRAVPFSGRRCHLHGFLRSADVTRITFDAFFAALRAVPAFFRLGLTADAAEDAGITSMAFAACPA